jgi:hypothetical protein
MQHLWVSNRFEPESATSVAMAAAPGVRLWFRLDAASAATSVVVPSDAIVDDLRDKIKEKLADDARGVPAFKLVLSTADGKTYDDPRALVSTLPLDKEFIVTGTFVRAARSLFAAAYGPRSSCGGRTWTRARRSR